MHTVTFQPGPRVPWMQTSHLLHPMGQQMFRSRRPKDMTKLRQKLAEAAVSLAEAAPSEESGSEGEREPPLAVDLQAHPDPVGGLNSALGE